MKDFIEFLPMLIFMVLSQLLYRKVDIKYNLISKLNKRNHTASFYVMCMLLCIFIFGVIGMMFNISEIVYFSLSGIISGIILGIVGTLNGNMKKRRYYKDTKKS